MVKQKRQKRPKITCRLCGGWGYETPDDPCPGVCPRCFEQGVAAAFGQGALSRKLGDPDPFAVVLERLTALGVTAEMIASLREQQRTAEEST